jgi:hypothetical protein
MTEDEHIHLGQIGDHFYDELGKLTAQCLDMLLPGQDEAEAIGYLQDMASLYSVEHEKYRKKNEEDTA